MKSLLELSLDLKLKWISNHSYTEKTKSRDTSKKFIENLNSFTDNLEQFLVQQLLKVSKHRFKFIGHF